MTAKEKLRTLPSVDELVREASDVPHALAVRIARRELAKLRGDVLAEAANPEDAGPRLRRALDALSQPSLRKVINATGVVLHTNLGRASLEAFEPIAGYSNLEYDLSLGKRGKRDQHLAPLLDALLERPAIVVNNNASAVYLVLHELAAGHEVIVSRGELIEIGDGFRIPDIMAQSGAILREVGATNRTTIEDYRQAISDRTRLIMRVHPSNFHMSGFSAKPSLEQLAALGREHKLPVYEDLGSGCLVDLKPWGVDEPLAQASLEAGIDLVSFSTDKLLGGPQSGIIAGENTLVQRIRRNPMYRAFRVDKLITQALEQTLRSLVFEKWNLNPTLKCLSQSPDELRARALILISQLELNAEVIQGESVLGGGSTPDQVLPAWLIAIRDPKPSRMEKHLRLGTPAVIARIENDRLVLDLRTVSPSEESELRAALESAAAQARSR